LSANGEVLEEGKLDTTKVGLDALFKRLAPVRVAMETGTHSAWISRQLTAQGHEVYVANARKLRMIFESKRKNDRVDALKLAQLGRFDAKLLHPVQHRAEQTQLDLVAIRSRENLVEARTKLINQVRGQTKSLGHRLESKDTEKVGPELAKDLPEDVRQALQITLEATEQLTEAIHRSDAQIHEIAKRYPEIELLTAIYGVGELTALAFVLTIEDAGRFDKSREVGAYLGLTPGEAQSGDSDPQQRITKEGDRMMRWLLVQCAHCILRKNAPDCDLKRWGEKKLLEELTKPGKKRNQRKKKVLTAVARKLAVLMHRLWSYGEVYDPLHNAKLEEAKSKTAA
jgi:transposase